MSVRSAMLANANLRIQSPHQFGPAQPVQIFFKDEAKRLWQTIDGLGAQRAEVEDAVLHFSLGGNKALPGWEHMDVVADSTRIFPKATTPRRASGLWRQYAKDINAVVFFGANFGEIFRPMWPPSLRPCIPFRDIFQDRPCLLVQVKTLRRLFQRQGFLQTQERLTSSGLILQRFGPLRMPCGRRMPSPRKL